MAKKTVKVNEVVAFELPEGEDVKHAAEFNETKKSEIKIGDKFVHQLGVNRQVHEVYDITGGPGAPGGALYFLIPVATRPRVGEQLFITVTEKILKNLFKPLVGRPPLTEAEPTSKLPTDVE